MFFFYVTSLSVLEVSLELEKFSLACIEELALLVFLCSLLICCFVSSACGVYGVIKDLIKVFFSLISHLKKISLSRVSICDGSAKMTSYVQAALFFNLFSQIFFWNFIYDLIFQMRDCSLIVLLAYTLLHFL